MTNEFKYFDTDEKLDALNKGMLVAFDYWKGLMKETLGPMLDISPGLMAQIDNLNGEMLNQLQADIVFAGTYRGKMA